MMMNKKTFLMIIMGVVQTGIRYNSFREDQTPIILEEFNVMGVCKQDLTLRVITIGVSRDVPLICAGIVLNQHYDNISLISLKILK